MTDKEFKRIVSMNEEWYNNDPELFDAMVNLSIISAIAERLGKMDISKNATKLFYILADELTNRPDGKMTR